jgi:hypothetical protein
MVTPALTTPNMQRSRAYTCSVWALPFSIASTGGVDVSFFPAGTEMGQFPAFPTVHYGFMHGPRIFPIRSFPNLGHPRILSTACVYPGFSQLTTSFVGSWCLGILTYTLSSLI